MTASPGAGPDIRRLRKRAEFVRAQRGKRAGRPAFALQMTENATETPGVGFTVTKKVGNSPERNRVKRRLREAARACAGAFLPRHDYVLLGRREALDAPFDTLLRDLRALLTKLHAKPVQGQAPQGRGNTD